MCRVFPDRKTMGPRGQHWEVASTTCVAHCAIGGRQRWIHESAVPCLIWLFMMKAIAPDVCLHENSPLFLAEMLQKLSPAMSVSTLLVSPQDRGEPFRCKRRYTAAVSNSSMDVFAPFDREHLGAVCFCRGHLAGRCLSQEHASSAKSAEAGVGEDDGLATTCMWSSPH